MKPGAGSVMLPLGIARHFMFDMSDQALQLLAMGLDERKALIIEAMRRLRRPIWIGDLGPSASEYASFERAFRSLLAEGRIALDHRAARGRKYYALTTHPLAKRSDS